MAFDAHGLSHDELFHDLVAFLAEKLVVFFATGGVAAARQADVFLFALRGVDSGQPGLDHPFGVGF